MAQFFSQAFSVTSSLAYTVEACAFQCIYWYRRTPWIPFLSQPQQSSIQATKHSDIYPLERSATPPYTAQPYTTSSAQCKSPTPPPVLQRAKASCQCLLESYPASHQANPLSSCPRSQSFVNFRQLPSANAASALKVRPSPRVRDSNGPFYVKRSSASSLAPSTQSCLVSGATQS
jgi:hypothetical protein